MPTTVKQGPPPSAPEQLVPTFRSREALVQYLLPPHERERLDTEKAIRRIEVMMQTDDGRKQLLQRLQEADPSLNGNVEAALEQVNLNREQLQKKESFLKKMLMLPVRGLQAVGRTVKKHPILSAAAGIAVLVAILYLIPMLAPGVGVFRDNLIEGGKEILRKIGVPLPEPGVDAIADVPVTGGPVGPDVIEKGRQILESPANVDEHIHKLQEIINP